jgi:hypothetical protein
MAPWSLTCDRSEIVVHDTRFTGNQTNVTVGGSIATSPGGRNTLAIIGRVNLRILNLQSPDIISSGVAVLNDGRRDHENTRINGRASVTGASVSIYLGDQRVAMSNLNGAVLFNAKQMQIESPRGRSVAVRSALPAAPRLSSRFRSFCSTFAVTRSHDYPADFRSTVTL